MAKRKSVIRRANPAKGIKFGLEYDPVVENRNTTGFTKMSVQEYWFTKGMVARDLRRSTVEVYVAQPAAEVLKEVFPNYHVTQFNDRKFFASHDRYKSTPMKGLYIGRVSPDEGVQGITTAINGKLPKILELPEFAEVKRENPITPEELEIIRAHIMGEDHIGVGHPRMNRWARGDKDQMAFDEKEILGLIGIQ